MWRIGAAFWEATDGVLSMSAMSDLGREGEREGDEATVALCVILKLRRLGCDYVKWQNNLPSSLTHPAVWLALSTVAQISAQSLNLEALFTSLLPSPPLPAFSVSKLSCPRFSESKNSLDT